MTSNAFRRHNSGDLRRLFMMIWSVLVCLCLLKCNSVSNANQEQDDGSCDANSDSVGTIGSSSNNQAAAADAAATTTTDAVVPCNVYMAPSTLGDNTNLGIYTAKDLVTDEVVNYPEIAIPLLFRDFDTHPPYAKADGQLWDRYIWEGTVTDIETYDDENREASRSVFVPGVGCTVNSILDMKNIQSTHGSTYNTAGLSRATDPGSGAFSPYYNAQTKSVTEIPAGSELFAEYGDSWIPHIPGAAVTLNKNLDEAEDFLDDYWKWYQELKEKYGNLAMFPDLAEGLWNLTSQEFPLKANIFTVLPRTDWKTVQASLAERDALEKATDEEESFSVVGDYIRESGMRSLQWLKENGKCQDHMEPGRSTIHQAGRGAFATRSLPKGTVVGFAPLVHIGEAALDIWSVDYNSDLEGSYKKLDLIINYSFGHANSTLILTPYGAMVNYINHDKERANVKVQWPQQELIAHKPDWLTKDIPFLRNTIEKIGLSFDYVALRDIEKGEEIFLDYGPEWEAAWSEHVKNWKPPPDAELYKHSSEYKLDFFRTMEELKLTPYPPNLHTMCYESYYKNRDTGRFEFLPVLRKDAKRVFCNVLMRRQEEPTDGSAQPRYSYTVALKPGGPNTEGIVAHKYESDAIFLYDKAFSADWHLKNAFRHKIMIPDDVFPEMWRNLS